MTETRNNSKFYYILCTDFFTNRKKNTGNAIKCFIYALQCGVQCTDLRANHSCSTELFGDRRRIHSDPLRNTESRINIHWDHWVKSEWHWAEFHEIHLYPTEFFKQLLARVSWKSFSWLKTDRRTGGNRIRLRGTFLLCLERLKIKRKFKINYNGKQLSLIQ